MKLIMLIFLALNLTACASYMTRKSCEATNWYDYGQKVAMEGRRLSGDQFILECYKAEGDVAESALDQGFKSGMERYCQPETVFQTGKAGNFFSTEMCTGQGMNVLLIKHRQGVLEFCQKSNGYSAGAKGKAYNKICPAQLEAQFMPEFNRGRKRYLATLVDENEKEISTLDRDLSRLKNDMRIQQIELQRYSYVPKLPGDKQVDKSVEFSSQIRQLQSSISAKETLQESLREKNRQIKMEIVQLEN